MSIPKPHDHILDPSIAEAVRILQEHGVETCEACEGNEGRGGGRYVPPAAMAAGVTGHLWSMEELLEAATE